jgi:hypothetical protein
MKYLFNFRMAWFFSSFRLKVLMIGFFLPFVLHSQGLMVNLPPSDTAFMIPALGKIPVSKDFVYLAVYSVQISGNSQQPTKEDNFVCYVPSRAFLATKTPAYVAGWIANPTNKVDLTKKIVLLSSATPAAAQALADELGKKGKKVPIINWDEEVLLYQNGNFLPYGKCQQYEANLPPKELTGTDIPQVNNPFLKDTVRIENLNY